MHVILATMGTDGDVFPYLELGAVIAQNGHRVTLAAPATYQAHAVACGLEFCSLVTVEEVDRMLAEPDLWHPLRSGLFMTRWGGPLIPRQYAALDHLSREPGSVIVANPGLLAARLVQEKRGCPMASLLLQPGLLPSCIAPPTMPAGLSIPPWLPTPLRRLYWLGIDAAGLILINSSLNRFRATLGLPPVRRLFRWWLSPQLVIGLFPEWYAPRQADWPPQIKLAGFGRFNSRQAELQQDLTDFCNRGSSPVAFTLGTGMRHASSFFRDAVAACESIGAKGLLLTKYSDLIPRNLPSTIRHVPFAPFDLLLPWCSAIVHHGGVGTTAAAFAAGCPQLVLPLAWDQPDNAARIAKHGAGIVLGPRRRGRTQLAKALSSLMTQRYRNRCRAIASDSASDDGFLLAAKWTEDLAKSTDLNLV